MPSTQYLVLLCLLSLASAPSRAAGKASPGRTHVNAVGSDDGQSRPDYFRYQNQAFPNDSIDPQQSRAARAAWGSLGSDGRGAWRQVAPSVNPTPAIVTYTGRDTTVSGRVTALALSPGCGKDQGGDCHLWLGAAGGGVWRLEDPTEEDETEWSNASTGLTSNAIGSLAVDPSGRGRILYAGTGEQNSSGDSEAGVGLFKSTNGGDSWQLLPASVPFADGLSIASIVVDPRDGNHLWFGTMTALHGSAASANASVPPHTANLGLFESIDGGATFGRVFSTGPGKSFWGVQQIAQDPNDLDTLYVSIMGGGVYRSSAKFDGDAGWRRLYSPSPDNDGFDRTAIALANRGKTTRIYLANSVDATGESAVYRVDDASVSAGFLTDGAKNFGWTPLSDPTPGTPGYGSWGFCESQCWYDIFIGTPPGQPDVVWIGGSMNYGEVFTATPPSNGRAVMRSTDAGVHFTDMTADARSPALGMHPDQHAIVFNPRKPGMAFIGSDGGLVRTSGVFVDNSADCLSRPIGGLDLLDCQAWLSSIPARIDSLNAGLPTLQFQSVSLNPKDPAGEWMGGTQDNGTWSYGGKGSFFESIGGDGGQSGFDAVNPNVRVHTYYNPSTDVNFRGADPLGWNWIADPLYLAREPSAFYMPIITDPVVGGSMFAGLAHVFRTKDSGGPQDYLEAHCNEYTGDFTVQCGDWVPLGFRLTGAAFGADRIGGAVVAVARSTGDTGTLWGATRRGRVLVTRNADAAAPASVAFARIDSFPATPGRVVSDLVIDPKDGAHGWVAYTGYGAYTPYAPGHVYEARVPAAGPPVFTDLSYNLGDLPVTALVRDHASGDLYAGTDFGVLRLPAGAAAWTVAATGLPPVAVYHLALSPSPKLLYAATHGRSVWRLDLSSDRR